MKAFPSSVAQALRLKNEIHLVLPHFQREYRWGKVEREKLWADAIATYEILPDVCGAEREPEHFLGALVVISDAKYGPHLDMYRIVDGQQRLTTLSLLLCALGNAAKKSQPIVYKKCRNLLVNEDYEGNFRFKLLPTTKNDDRAIYAAVIEGKPLPLGNSRIPEAYSFFEKHIEAHLDARSLNLEHLYKVVAASFQVVWVEFDPNENAHQIFESLNTTGQRLTQVDLVRNYIAMSLPLKKQDEVFADVWLPLEKLLDDTRKIGKSGLGELSAFLRHYDAMNSGHLPAKENIYARLRDQMRDLDEHGLTEKLHEIKRFAGLYDQLLHPDKGTDKKLGAALEKLLSFDALTAYPFLMAVFSRYAENPSQLSGADCIEICQVLENFFVRCFLTGIKSNAYDKVMAGLTRKVDWHNIVFSLQQVLIESGYPSDSKVRQMLPPRPLYEVAPKDKIVLLFERINAAIYARSGVATILNGPPSIEHILPQNPAAAWSEDLGEELASIKGEWLHSIGNLTILTGEYNTSLSNKPFAEKQKKLVSHGLRLNSDYFSQSITKWDDEAIQARANWLVEQILQIWPSFPGVASEKLRASKTPAPKSVTIRGVRVETKYWSDVMRAVVEFFARQGANFETLNEKFPHLVAPTPFAKGNQSLSNGWFLTTNWNQQMQLDYCRKMLDFQGVDQNEWQIEESGSEIAT